jgi:hypothetical protein
LVLAWRYDGFVWVCGTHVIVLKSFGTCDPICGVAAHHLLVLHHIVVPHTAHLILLIAHELLILLHHHLLIILLMSHVLLARIERNLNSSIRVSYFYKNKIVGD